MINARYRYDEDYGGWVDQKTHAPVFNVGDRVTFEVVACVVAACCVKLRLTHCVRLRVMCVLCAAVYVSLRAVWT
jgi:hypothetical protein